MSITPIITGSAFSTCALAATLLVSGSQAVTTLPPEDTGIVADFEDLFVVGKEAGADQEMLFGLVDVAFAADGELYALEERNHRVVVYGPDGRFLRSFGREGQGPGEFQLPMSLAVTTAEEVAVWDLQNRAYLVFTRDGDYVRNVSWDDWLKGPSRDSLRRWPGGGVAYLPPLVHEDSDPAEDLNRGAILREPLGDTGAAEELLTVQHPRRRGKEVAGVLELTSGPVFSPFARWDVISDGRIAVVDGVGYSIRLIDPDGGAVTILGRDIMPRPVNDADREHEREKKRLQYERPAGSARFGGSGGGRITPQMIGRIVAAMEFAEELPVIRDLRVDADDRLWIQRHGDSYDDDGPVDIVAVDGHYLGTLPPMPMPDAFGPDGLVAWMENGRDVDVERVVVRRLPAVLR